MRKFRHVGTYVSRDMAVPLAAQCGDFVVVDAVTLLHTPGMVERIRGFSHLRVVLQLHVVDQVWTDPTYQWDQLAHIRVQLEQAGLWDRILAIIVDEECMLGAYGGGPAGNRFARLGCTSHDDYERIAWVQRGLERAISHVRHHMPGKFLGHVETCWHEGRAFGAAYYRPIPAGLDFLGIDAYVNGPITREEFDRQVRPILSHAGTLGYDILLVGQAFEDASRSMPSQHQMHWWIEAAPPRTAGVAWFTLEHPGRERPDLYGYGRGLADYPMQLAAVQWYAGLCGLVPSHMRAGGV